MLHDWYLNKSFIACGAGKDWKGDVSKDGPVIKFKDLELNKCHGNEEGF